MRPLIDRTRAHRGSPPTTIVTRESSGLRTTVQLSHVAHGNIRGSRLTRGWRSSGEGEVHEYVLSHGFPERVVAEKDVGRFADNQLCIAPLDGGRWPVYFTERGVASDRVDVPSHAARREVVRRLMLGARIALNHRYRLAHPDKSLPLPSEMD